MRKIRIKLTKNVSSDYPQVTGFDYTAMIGEYDAVSNPQGAISIVTENGKMLGIKPSEFEFVEAPAWVLEKHGKLSSKYEALQMDYKQLQNDIINANMNSEFAIDLSIELKEEVERLKQERDSQQRCAIEAMQEVERLKQDNERLCSENRTIWFKDYIKQSEQIKQLEKEVEELRQELDSANECNTVLYSEVERLKQENEKLRDALDAWQNSR